MIPSPAIRVALFVVATIGGASSLAAQAVEVPFEPSVAPTTEERASEERAIRLYSEFIESDPGDATWHLLRMRSRRQIGDRAGAAQDLAAVRKLDPYRADVEEGIECRRARDLETAERLLTRAIDTEPTCGEAYYYRALVYSDRRLFRRALNDLEQSLTYSEPNSQDFCRTRYEQGKIYHHLGQDEAAVAAMNGVIERHFEIVLKDAVRGVPVFPLNPHYYFLRASAYVQLDDHRRAIDDFTTCEELGARWPELYDERANCHRALGELEREKADRARCELLQAKK